MQWSKAEWCKYSDGKQPRPEWCKWSDAELSDSNNRKNQYLQLEKVPIALCPISTYLNIILGKKNSDG